uniref:Peptidase M14 domain-containing protein n=1 Tax=Ciona savignyi TaxID=51511 RepID=H2Z179_CIOSA
LIQVDFWSPDDASGVTIGQPADIRFPGSYVHVAKELLQDAGMMYETKIANLQELVDQQFDLRAQPRAAGYDYNIYHTYAEIQQWIADMSDQYPHLARKSLLTTSTEGREVNMLSHLDKPIFLIDCGVHAREWISPAFCQYFIHRMLSQYGVDQQVSKMMDEMTWKIVPLLNVDGYQYTWTNDRMWRKTRSNYGTVCTGVDANRNFDINWSGEGASSDPCSNTYCGPSLESEPIVKALSDIIRADRPNIKAYIAFHSYSQVFVYPYSYAYEDTPNADQLFDVSKRAADAIYDVGKTKYTWGPGYDSMYLVSGGSKDMAYNHGIPLSWTVELRDTGRYGFLLPESQISGTCTETFQAVSSIFEDAY